MESENNVKKTFDKKKWREKKYNKRFRLNKWDERRQKIILQKYNRTLKKNNMEPSNVVKEPITNKKKGISGIKAAQLEYNRIVEEKKKKKEEKTRKQKEIQEALERYKKKKLETYKKLSKKTKKGQPLMKERLELMFEKVKKCVGSC